jgi:hypothetical protein
MASTTVAVSAISIVIDAGGSLLSSVEKQGRQSKHNHSGKIFSPVSPLPIAWF